MEISAAAPVGFLVASPPQEPLEAQRISRIRRWADRIGSQGMQRNRDDKVVDEYLDILCKQLQSDPDRLVPVGETWLLVLSVGLNAYPKDWDYGPGGGLFEVRRKALARLQQVVKTESGARLLQWIFHDVLLGSHPTSLAQRFAALYLVNKAEPQGLDTALLELSRRGGDALRPEALRQLPRRNSAAVDNYLVDNLGRPFDLVRDPHPYNLMMERLRRELPLGAGAQARLYERVQAMMIHDDWREAARGIGLARELSPLLAAPLFIEALHIWTDRDGQNRSLRLVHELASNLRRLSGKSIGSDPRRWRSWWRAVAEGRAELSSTGAPPPSEGSETSFFGLNAVSDRLTFIIDHSGSMNYNWGSSKSTRYEEAIRQMMVYLQAVGPSARFNVILFSSEPLRSTPHLVEATPKVLEAAKRSLLSRTPDGGTNLKPAVELALSWKRGGSKIELPEADTVIVLCDGVTAEGLSWVAPLIQSGQAESQVIFHCVQIGAGGDGTLEALAEITGGQFVRVTP